ncbi:hypothetical protein SISNIDRAFT_475006 [Sistotremastrum niveocremeum HHB9708]|uniref:Pierisin-like domain-containing protein n=1 Tax=Sistotremastrum niveocremeum HHB9708 TaxID=1314777 RepID=A0A164SKZ6_9AGAM|nr:hypothetical protein SISNIDRAFT_475006 [Sistotremastrum niveocremeum HHB9708]
MSSLFFDTSTIDWFRDDNYSRQVIDTIAGAEQQIKPGRRIFRRDVLYDAITDDEADVSGERLLRWDRRGPDVIFRDGFEPRVKPGPGEFPSPAFNLRQYVLTNNPSIFVSTARYYRNKDHTLLRLGPFNPPPSGSFYEYEIFGYGGIDVNAVLGKHVYENEHEIAFPGGVHPRFIRSVREYQKGDVVASWFNPRFGVGQTPSSRIVVQTDLPTPLLVPGRVIHYFSDSVVSKGFSDKAIDHSLNWDDLMHGTRPFTEFPDKDSEDDGGIPDPDLRFALPFTSVSSIPDASTPGFAYFFCWNQYIRIKAGSGGQEKGDVKPQPLLEGWPSLVTANFGAIDAILPSPDDKDQYYIFFHENCALLQIDLKSGKNSIVNPPRAISDYWPSLDRAGFTTVDAVIPINGTVNEAFVFSGEYYVRIRIQKGVVDPPNDDIIYGPKKFRTEWPSLHATGFRQIHSILPDPNNKDQAYFFSGNSYALIHFEAGIQNDYIVDGPKLVYKGWPSLHKALFW